MSRYTKKQVAAAFFAVGLLFGSVAAFASFSTVNDPPPPQPVERIVYL